jgi:hypothetical protein
MMGLGDLVAGQRFEVADVECDAELLPRGDSQCRLGCGWAERGRVDGDLLRSIEDRQRLQIVGLDALRGEGAAVVDDHCDSPNEKADRDIPADRRIVTLSTCVCQVLSVTFRGVKVLEQNMDAEESRTAKALKLVDAGLSPADAAKACDISRQAVDDALKRRKLREAKMVRTCSECGGELPTDARADASTCSGACRVARARRLAKEKKAEALAKINAERAALGYSPLSELM